MADERRFLKVYQQIPKYIGEQISIFVDKATGVNYLFMKGGNAGGLTPLLDREGKPVITAVPSEE